MTIQANIAIKDTIFQIIIILNIYSPEKMHIKRDKNYWPIKFS